MRRLPRSATVLCATTCLLLPGFAAPAAGQQEPDERPFQAEAAAPLVSVDFPGGSALEYVEALRDAAGDINVVAAPETHEVRMPPVSLRKVTVAAALALLDGKDYERPGRRVSLSVRRLPTYTDGERPTFEIRANAHGFSRPERAARVWSLASPLDRGVAADGALSAVETALALVSSDRPPVVRFHEDTHLLIATGTHQELETIEDVVERLGESVENPCAEQIEAITARLERVQRERRDASEQVEMLRRRAADLEQEIHQTERELTRVRVRLEAAQRELKEKRSRGEPDSSR